MPGGSDVVILILNFVFAVLVLFTNSIVIIVIIKSRQLHLPTLWNLAFMAAWDFLLGLHMLVFVVPSKIAGAFVYPDIYGVVALKIQGFIFTQNTFNVIMAVVDRYLSICWPLHYQRIMSLKRFTCAVISGLLVNLLRSLVLLFNRKNTLVYNKVLGYFSSSEKETGFFVLAGFSLATLTIIIGFLIRIRLELRKTQSNTGRDQTISTQFTYTMYLSVLVYVVSYLPATITMLVEIITGGKNDYMLQIGMTCILSNSMWNVLIYSATYLPFKDALVKLFCPTYSRERARREVQVQFRRNRVSVITVAEA